MLTCIRSRTHTVYRVYTAQWSERDPYSSLNLFLQGAFRLIITVKDDDHPFADDAVDTIVIQRRLSPGDSERDTFYGRHIGDFRMDVTVTVGCDANFYGSSCNILCVPRDDKQGHYTCNSRGHKVCNVGWIDPFYSCTTRKF